MAIMLTGVPSIQQHDKKYSVGTLRKIGLYLMSLFVDLVWLIKVLYCCLFIAHRQNIQSITPSETYEDPSKWFLNMYWISWLDQSRKEINCLILNQSPYCSSSTWICIKTCSFQIMVINYQNWSTDQFKNWLYKSYTFNESKEILISQNIILITTNSPFILGNINIHRYVKNTKKKYLLHYFWIYHIYNPLAHSKSQAK